MIGLGSDIMFCPYLGKEYSNEEIKTTLNKYKDQIEFEFVSSEISKMAGKAVAEGKIIGWFQNRSECGPRALGNRSILADPRNPEMKNTLNKRVKFRESFRPFAPAVLWEYQEEYFLLKTPSPFMLMVCDVIKSQQEKIPSVTHIDGTARIQTVLSNLCPKFYSLIYEFYQITNIPIVINTSFNIKGEPIVETPFDAINCFVNTQIDELYIGNFIVKRLGGA